MNFLEFKTNLQIKGNIPLVLSILGKYFLSYIYSDFFIRLSSYFSIFYCYSRVKMPVEWSRAHNHHALIAVIPHIKFARILFTFVSGE